MKMWRFQNLLIILCTAFSFLPQTASVIQVFGYEGRHVKISCSNQWFFTSNEKYFCKEDCHEDDDVLITTKQQRKNRYSISDDENKRIFTVTISDLKLYDTGTYSCGVSRVARYSYTEVKLTVIKDSCCDEVTQIQGDEGGSVSIKCPYESKKKNVLKYVCRRKQPSTCLQRALITSDRQNKRFRLTDDWKSRTIMTIYNLTLNDSGSYLCGVQSDSGLDDFSAFELEVKELCRVKSSTIRGIVGRPVTFKCSNPPRLRDKEKFFCKGDQLNSCTDMMTNPTKFRLHQLSSSCFSVTITELEAGDAGRYFCGPDSLWSLTHYTKIQLEVVSPHESSTVSLITMTGHVTSPPPPSSSPFMTLLYNLPAVVLLLIITLVVCMFFKKKSKKLQVDGVGVVMDSVGPEEETRINDICENPEGSAHTRISCRRENSPESQQHVYQSLPPTEDIYSVCQPLH